MLCLHGRNRNRSTYSKGHKALISEDVPIEHPNLAKVETTSPSNVPFVAGMPDELMPIQTVEAFT